MGAVAPLHGPRLALSGLACDGLDPQEGQLGSGMAPAAPGYGEGRPGRLVTAQGAHEAPIEPGAYPAFYAGMRDWLAGAAPPPVEPADAVAVLAILDAARESAATRTVVEL